MVMGFPVTSSFHAISSQHPLLHLHSYKYNLNGSNSHCLISMSLHRHSHHLPSKSHSINTFNLTHKNTNIIRNSPRNSNLTVRASTNNTPQLPSPSSPNSQLIIISSVVTVALAVANRVLYKLALVPMKQYPFFLAQLTTFG